MAYLHWRRFTFFDKVVVKGEGDAPFEKLQDLNITACTSGRGQMIFGDSEGNFHFLNRQLQLVSLKAYVIKVTLLQQLRQNPILVSVGEDEPGINPLIKVWNLDKVDRNGFPMCTRIVRAIRGNKPSQVTAIAVHENLALMAVGFLDGSVLIFKGDVTRDRHSKQKVLHEGSSAVTGLALRVTPKLTHLFVVTTNNVYSYNVVPRDKETKFHVDAIGTCERCVTLTDSKQDNLLVVARSDAVYFYQPDGRGPCLAFEGEKYIVHWFRGYLVVIGKGSGITPQTTPMSGPAMEMNLVTVYDIQNKFVAYSAPVPAVIDVISEWGSLYVLGGDRKLYHLQEKDTQSKLDTLFKKNLYVMAIQLAVSQQYDEDGLVDIFRQYGDHLYNKGDHDGAIAQYIRTIGRMEASYVIRKFLDAQRIHNLTAYLQALHKKGLATEDHTTLLLNCYTKLKDINKLDEFIMGKDREIDFDVETAIRVCRQAGYFKHALYLAAQHDQHDWFLKIQLEDLKDHHDALRYIARLDFFEAESYMKKYGKVLIGQVPQQTTDFLKRLCTDYRPSEEPLVDAVTMDGSGVAAVQRAAAEEFIHIFVNNTQKLREFLEHMIKVQTNCPSAVYNMLLEVYLREYVHCQDVEKQKELEKNMTEFIQKPDSGYDLDQALILCQMNNFSTGLLLLYEKAKLFREILKYHCDRDDYAAVMNTCHNFGSQDANLWVQALQYFVTTDNSQHTYLTQVIEIIEKKRLLPPLLVIDIVGSSQIAPLGLVKDYVIRQLQQEQSQIAEDERLIAQYAEDTKKMRNQIEDGKTNAKIFQVAKCSACCHTLELPSVHFLCQHSYHQHCFESYAESDNECIVCMADNKKVVDMIRAQEQSKDLHEQFHHQLERAEDGFKVVADYFGRGVFNKVTVIPEKPRSRKPKKPAVVSTNPFDDYDNSLNPFESGELNVHF